MAGGRIRPKESTETTWECYEQAVELPGTNSDHKAVAIQGLTPPELQVLLGDANPRETRKIVSHFHRTGGFEGPLEQVRRRILDEARARLRIGVLTLVERQTSTEDPFQKLLLETEDGQRIETVRIPLERANRVSVCVSSQVGCALRCTFCATGRMGLKRNLETWEIVEQVRAVRATMEADVPAGTKPHIHGVVFQGMGEPLANLERVLGAIRVLNDSCGLAIDARNITVTTSGLPAGIRTLASEAPKVRLGLSIGSARPTVRKSLMPIAEAHSWEDVFEASVFHAERTGMAPMWAVTPLSGHNDTNEDAESLATEIVRFQARTGHRPRLTLIPYNAIGADDPFERQSAAQEVEFAAALARYGAPPKRRYSGGGDIQAACGQLATSRP
jgi:23S rRNA (adenine2503-C2)-methyltransferase